MQFGSFHYPDFFTFKDASAVCLECGVELFGRAIINAGSSDSCVAMIEGELVCLCGDHHDKMRRFDGGPQHAVFRVVVGGRKLGETNPISSMVGEVYFHITDVGFNREFAQKHRELQIAFRRFWGY